MITEIFTGHAIDLADIRAIGTPATRIQTSASYMRVSTLFISIHLADNVTIQNDRLRIETFAGQPLDEKQTDIWNQAFDELTAQRAELIELWNAHKQTNRPHEIQNH